MYLRIKIRKEEREIEDLAKANAGFSIGIPAILLSDKAVKMLGPMKTLAYITLDVATEIPFPFHFLGKVYVKVIEEDRESDYVTAYAIYYPGKRYSLMSDLLLDDLGIILLEPGKGRWKFRDDPPNIVRETVYTPKFNLREKLKKEGLL